MIIRARGLSKRFKSSTGEVARAQPGGLGCCARADAGLAGAEWMREDDACCAASAGLKLQPKARSSLRASFSRPCAENINLPPERRNLGMMFQSFGLWPHMTVAENVAYPLKNRRDLTRD